MKKKNALNLFLVKLDNFDFKHLILKNSNYIAMWIIELARIGNFCLCVTITVNAKNEATY